MYYKKFSLLEILIPFDKVYKVWNILVMNLKSFTNIKILFDLSNILQGKKWIDGQHAYISPYNY